MPIERPGATTLRGNPLTVLGPELKTGEKAPDFQAIDDALKPVNLEKTGHGVRIFSVIPSLDTPMCDAQTKRFNEEAAKQPAIEIYTVSMDLPFAQQRWCGNFGTLIKELRIQSRAIFVVDQENKIRNAEYVKEVADHPDYEAALTVAR